MKLQGPHLREYVDRLKQAPYFDVKGIYFSQDGEYYKMDQYDELDAEDECVLVVSRSQRGAMEDYMAEDVACALPKKCRAGLRRALKQMEVTTYAVDISEVFSPARKAGMVAGKPYDLVTGFDLANPSHKKKMWKELKEDDPELITNSPPCTPFSPLQGWNFPTCRRTRWQRSLRRALNMWQRHVKWRHGNTEEASFSSSSILNLQQLGVTVGSCGS